jgi:hypothetical protein
LNAVARYFHEDAEDHSDDELENTDLKVEILLIKRLTPNQCLFNTVRYDIKHLTQYEVERVEYQVFVINTIFIAHIIQGQ